MPLNFLCKLSVKCVSSSEWMAMVGYNAAVKPAVLVIGEKNIVWRNTALKVFALF